MKYLVLVFGLLAGLYTTAYAQTQVSSANFSAAMSSLSLSFNSKNFDGQASGIKVLNSLMHSQISYLDGIYSHNYSQFIRDTTLAGTAERQAAQDTAIAEAKLKAAQV